MSPSNDRYTGPFTPFENFPCETAADCVVSDGAAPNACFAEFSDGTSFGGCACSMLTNMNGTECLTPTTASRNQLVLMGALLAYAVYVSATRASYTSQTVRLGLWSWNASSWTIIWAWCLIGTVGAHVIAEMALVGVPTAAAATIAVVLSHVQLAFLLLAVLTIVGAFVESASTMRHMKDLNRATVPIRVFVVSVFATLVALVATDRLFEANVLVLIVVSVLVVLTIIGPLQLYFKFARTHGRAGSRTGSKRGSKSTRVSRLGQTGTHTPGGMTPPTTITPGGSSRGEDDDEDVRRSCCAVAREIFDRVVLNKAVRAQGPVDHWEGSSHQGSRGSHNMVTPPRSRAGTHELGGANGSGRRVVADPDGPPRSRAATRDDFTLEDGKASSNGSLGVPKTVVDVTAVDQLIERRASSATQDGVPVMADVSLSRTSSKASVLSTSLNNQVSNSRPTSLRLINLNKVRDMLSGASSSIGGSSQASSARRRKRRKTKQQTDRVLKFLSRVIGLSMRLVACFVTFLVSTAVGLVLETRYSNNARVRPHQITLFFQILSMIMTGHAILWFLDYTLKKKIDAELEHREEIAKDNALPDRSPIGSRIGSYAEMPTVDHRGDSLAPSAPNSGPPSRTSSFARRKKSSAASRSRKASRKASRQRAAYYLEEEELAIQETSFDVMDMRELNKGLDSVGVVDVVVEEGDEEEE